MNKNEITTMKKTFDDYKHVDENGVEYWKARELSKAMGYTEYRNFEKAINRAKDQMKSTGKNPDDHFVESNKMIDLAKGAKREIKDYKLTKLAAHDVAMNGDPSKPEIAFAQEYFLQSTAKAEVIQQRLEDKQYIDARNTLSINNKKLAGTLLDHDVKSNEIGIVIDAGDRGFFDMSTQEIRDKLDIPDGKLIADKFGAEVASYKATAQYISERRINNENARGVEQTSDIVFDSNRSVRDLVESKTGESPENLITGEDIKKVKRRYERQNKLLTKALDESPAFRKYAEENF